MVTFLGRVKSWVCGAETPKVFCSECSHCAMFPIISDRIGETGHLALCNARPTQAVYKSTDALVGRPYRPSDDYGFERCEDANPKGRCELFRMKEICV